MSIAINAYKWWSRPFLVCKGGGGMREVRSLRVWENGPYLGIAMMHA
jgi:hypothetical protein